MVDDLELINEIVQMTAEGHLGPIRVAPRPVSGKLKPDFIAWIGIVGDWQGTIALSCSSRFARSAASEMFGVEREDLSAGQVTDALGELVNIVAGNFKAILDRRCVLKLPQVSDGEGALRFQSWKCLTQAAFSCPLDDAPIVVQVLREPLRSANGAIK